MISSKDVSYPKEYLALLNRLPEKMRLKVVQELDNSVDEAALDALLPQCKAAGRGIPELACAHDFNSFARAYLKHHNAVVRRGKMTEHPPLTDDQKKEIQKRMKESVENKVKKTTRFKTAAEVAREMMLPYKLVNDFVNPKTK